MSGNYFKHSYFISITNCLRLNCLSLQNNSTHVPCHWERSQSQGCCSTTLWTCWPPHCHTWAAGWRWVAGYLGGQTVPCWQYQDADWHLSEFVVVIGGHFLFGYIFWFPYVSVSFSVCCFRLEFRWLKRLTPAFFVTWHHSFEGCFRPRHKQARSNTFQRI